MKTLSWGALLALGAACSGNIDTSRLGGQGPGSDTAPTTTPTPTPSSGADAGESGPPVTGTPTPFTLYLTGYSYQDNTPPGSPIICCAVLHTTAGGTGTYADPITVASPGSGAAMQFKPGTRFWVERIKRYLMVEDSGASPSGPDAPHLDVWVGGVDGTKAQTDACESDITGNTNAIQNPAPDQPVIVGPIFSASKGCDVNGAGIVLPHALRR